MASLVEGATQSSMENSLLKSNLGLPKCNPTHEEDSSDNHRQPSPRTRKTQKLYESDKEKPQKAHIERVHSILGHPENVHPGANA